MAENGDDKSTNLSLPGSDAAPKSEPVSFAETSVASEDNAFAPKEKQALPLASKLLIGILVVNTFGVGLWIGSQFMSRDGSDIPRKFTSGQIDPKETVLPAAPAPRATIRNLGEFTVADIAEKVAPAVVAIEVTARSSAEKTLATALDAPTPQFFFG